MTTTTPDTWTRVGSVGVDAGCLLIVDPSYVWQRDNPALYAEVCDTLLSSADGHCQTLNDLAVIVESGIGDGYYPVEVRYEDSPESGRRIAEVRVRFLPHPYFDDTPAA
jgi:hypothetical protein